MCVFGALIEPHKVGSNGSVPRTEGFSGEGFGVYVLHGKGTGPSLGCRGLGFRV